MDRILTKLQELYPNVKFVIKDDGFFKTILFNDENLKDDDAFFDKTFEIVDAFLQEVDKEKFALVFDYLNEIDSVEIEKKVIFDEYCATFSFDNNSYFILEKFPSIHHSIIPRNSTTVKTWEKNEEKKRSGFRRFKNSKVIFSNSLRNDTFSSNENNIKLENTPIFKYEEKNLKFN